MLVIKAITTVSGTPAVTTISPAIPIPIPNYGVISYGKAYLVLVSQEEADIMFTPADASTDVDVTPNVTP
jgi:hypothetical protein